jgi:hypothetical protein
MFGANMLGLLGMEYAAPVLEPAELDRAAS